MTADAHRSPPDVRASVPDASARTGRGRRSRPRVLVTGVSIAGPTLAWGLTRAGFDVTLLERSAEQRQTGQNIDVRGIGKDVLDRLGVRDTVMQHLTGEVGTRYVEANGRPYAVFPGSSSGDGPTAEIEILRGRLAEILLDTVPDDVDLRYGDFISDVQQDDDNARVVFESGASEVFDLVVVAEGRSSRTRRRLFAEETQLRDFGVTITYGTIDRTPDDTDHWDWYTGTRGRVASMRPDNEGSIRASMSFESEPMGFENLPVESQLEILRARFDGVGWQAERILDGFEARRDEFYVQRMEQVVMSRWSKGRVVLIGDAAWGSGPTGMGTTLALVGAYVLAGELGETLLGRGTYQDAAARYEQLLRRYADSAQGLPRGGARLLHPSSRAGRKALQAVHRMASAKPVRNFAQKHLLTSEKHVPDLPLYEALRTPSLGGALQQADSPVTH